MRIQLPVVLIGTMLFTACDDPSAVGLALADGDAGRPEVVDIAPSRFDNEQGVDITGDTPRVLVGSVDDPIAGSVAARGYVGFQAVSSFTTEYLEGPVTAARLELLRDYRYGDTLSGGTLTLADIAEAWVSTLAPSDTVLAAGPAVATTTYDVADSVVVVELPPEWIARFDTILRSSAYADSFFGFEITAENAAAVVGFSATDSRLTVESGGATQDFGVLQRLSNITRTAEPNPPPGTLLLQDGAGPSVAIAFDLSTLSNAVFNRGEVVIETDRAMLDDNTPPDFVRPVPSSLEMLGITDTGLAIAFEEAFPDEEGRFVFDSNVLRNTLQDISRGDFFVDHFRFGFPSSANAVDVFLLADTTSIDRGPRTVLTVSRFRE